MLSVNNLTFEIGSRKLYDEADCFIGPGDRIGLIGANGTGKTTLLRILVGQYQPTGGTVSMNKGLKMGYLNQDLLSVHSDKSILEVALEAFEEQNQLEAEIADIIHLLETAYADELIDKLAEKQARFEALDGYNLTHKAQQILAGLGFEDHRFTMPLSSFSGGWRMRVMLAKILLQKPDLLLLDEPTNHLDLPSIQWLEDYLEKFEGAYIVVSHDRFFIDNVCDKILESKGGKLTLYHGDYEDYVEEKAQREEIQASQYKNQQQKIKQEERLIERFRAKASKAKMAQSRIKALNKLERVEAVENDAASVHFKFRFSRPSGRTVAQLKHVNKSYPGLSILSNADAQIEKGDKIVLVGANGKGKSTLLRIIAGVEKHEGELIPGHNVTTTFFAQHQLESLHLDNTLLQELVAAAPKHTETELRTILGCFLFAGDDVYKKIKVLSGGEKSRVALAKALTADANFLLLDEPGNHLDLASINILIQALQQYEGSFCMVSHDRYILSSVANKVWFIEDELIIEYPGSYDEWEEWYAERKKERDAQLKSQANKTVVAKQTVVKEEEKPKNNANEVKKLQRQLADIEQKLAELNKQLKLTEDALGLPENYEDATKLASLNANYAHYKTDITKTEEDWEQLAGQLMEMEG